MTIILTTHYLDEADEANQIYIVDHGKVIAQGSATAIKSQYASNILKIRFKEMKDLEKLLQTEMTVKEENELEYLFYPRTSLEAIEYLAKYEKKLILLSFVQVPWMMPLLYLQEERFANVSFIETEFYLIFS